MKNEAIFPWQQDVQKNLAAALQNKRLAHALLFVGPEGLGKKQLAHAFARAVLCQAPNPAGFGCEQCKFCQLTRAGTHPDYKVIAPEESGGAIKIDQIRAITDFVYETAMQNGRRVIIIESANAMNVNAANALLKTLEEPTPGLLFILLCEPHCRLPMTIKSRCQRIVFTVPESSVALAWLKNNIADQSIDLALLLSLADGAPLKALSLAENNTLVLREKLYRDLYLMLQKKLDPATLAKDWYENHLFLLMHLLLRFTQDILRIKTVAADVPLINEDFRTELQATANRLSLTQVQNYIDYVLEMYGYLVKGSNLNKQLVAEELVIKFIT